MNPKHISKVPDARKAIAPYNFVELPEKVVEVSPESLLKENRYCENRYTGRIECTLTTESPLYIRCGLTKEEFECGAESKDLPDFFYTNPLKKSTKPVIPGSSLRGMIRSLVEIVSFSKIDKVSDAQKFFFRAVAAEKDDPLKDEYIMHLGKQGKNVKAGYLQKQGDKWFIRPAKTIDNYPFVWIKEKTVIKSKFSGYIAIENISDDKPQYKPQYFINISFEDIQTNNGRKFAQKISSNSQTYDYNGVLLTSGNMLEGAIVLPDEVKRKNHCLIREPDPDLALIPVDDNAIQDYKNSLTPFQKQEPPFDSKMGVIKHGRAIFYCEPQPGEPVKLFGQSPNFRIPYYPKGNPKTASAIDFIPPNLRKFSIIDIADAIFGFVKQEKQPKEVEQSFAGRVFITNAQCQANNNDIWLESHPIIPKILTNPKPTTFQHYLVQPDTINATKKYLKHYASEPIKDTVIRGHKLYWHKGSNPEIKHPNPDEASDTQLTQLKPIKPGVNFEFTIHFENLSSVELGALMWVIDIAQDNKYRLSLGMGKPLGMGAVKVTHELYLSQRKDRYTKLFDDSSWYIPETVEKSSKYKDDFEEYILSQLTQGGIYEKVRKFTQIPRIQMLLAMLTWEENPSSDYLEQTRYMEIERKKAPCIGNDPNEYKERRVLPTPLKVIKEILPSEELTLTEGQVVEGTVIKIDRQQVPDGKKTKLKTTITYEIQGSDCPSKEEVNKQEVSLTIGDMVKVKIERCQGTSVRKVKRVE
ncbi:TIGR03986 family CRISPR-associated RAMP protein [Nostoc sphaeroides]|uniref:TIGR03986 family CRISPR-associated RAMP protein n=1 Tax=Nostoc sphaeroides CCNUC1 TaxID=2653204 RepID=A0A5P8WGZ1_9NOSO|nr:TIGR03986 family CRISPR-associated RAMP protein [Nostoc sphaeroides]QFS51964.1 TIGR03986 family CRISPR-associated RAMP protein [Nostoc sphaeroides CCNUC1]